MPNGRRQPCRAPYGSEQGDGRKGIDNFDIKADRNGDWSESYIIRLFDWHLKEQETMPGLRGPLLDFQDFSTHFTRTIPSLTSTRRGGAHDGTPKVRMSSIPIEQQTDTH